MKSFQLDHLGTVRVTGDDAKCFLQRQFTSNIEEISNTKASFGAYLSVKGRILANFLIIQTSSTDYSLVMPKGLIDTFSQRLKMFVLRDKVSIDQLHESIIHGFIESHTPDELNIELPAEDLGVSVSKNGTWIRMPGKKTRYLVIAELSDIGAGSNAIHKTNEWSIMDAEAGIPWISEKTRELLVPQAVNLDLIGAVSFTKGCYPGQEIVARLHYRGGVNHRMLRATSPMGSESAIGTPIKCDDLPGNQTATVIESIEQADADRNQLLVSLPLRFLASSSFSLPDECKVELLMDALPYRIPEIKI